MQQHAADPNPRDGRRSRRLKVHQWDKHFGSGVLSKTSGVPIIRPRRTSDYVRPDRRPCCRVRSGLWNMTTHAIAEMTMSTTFTAPAAPQGMAGQSWARKLVTTLERWWIAYMTWRVERAAIAALSAMSNRELKDIGLTRSEITSAVSKPSSRLEQSWRQHSRGEIEGWRAGPPAVTPTRGICW
jgi:uncharacterized protein YjiS (DUF1127 family)